MDEDACQRGEESQYMCSDDDTAVERLKGSDIKAITNEYPQWLLRAIRNRSEMFVHHEEIEEEGRCRDRGSN